MLRKRASAKTRGAASPQNNRYSTVIVKEIAEREFEFCATGSSLGNNLLAPVDLPLA
jgi:hypothetical protein